MGKKKIKDSPPFDEAISEQLFDYVNEMLKKDGCDNTLKYTKEFLSKNNLPVEKSLVWMNKNGGYCDCEVLMNVRTKSIGRSLK